MSSPQIPTGKAELSAARQALLSRLLGGNVKASVHSGRQAIAPRPRDVPAQLSFAQQRLWFLTQLEPESPLYNMPAALRLSGTLNVAALESALNEIVQRHESLRTTFSVIDEQLTQVIASEYRLQVPLTDLSGLSPHLAEEEARRLVSAEARKPFHLEHDVPVRAAVVRVAENDHLVLLTLHHIVADAWSMGVLVKEFAALYAAYASGQKSPLPALSVQYADFSYWQRQWLTGDILEQQLTYWKETLRGAPALLELPTDFPRPPVKTDNGATYEFSLDEPLTEGLEKLCKQTDTTMYMVLLAAFGTLLSRYSGQSDISIGTAIANRTRSEIEDLIGFFVNTLVMRIDVTGNPRFTDLLARTREIAMGAYAHQDLPFEHLVEALNPERNMSYSPLFQVSLIMQNAPAGNLQLPGLALRTAGSESTTAKFDISLRVTAVGDSLSASFEYNSDLFKRGTMVRMARHFDVLLRAIVAAPSSPLADLPMLPDDEYRTVVTDWNATARDYPAITVHERFEAQVRQTPHAIAVAFQAESLSYVELNARANRVARYLRAQGVVTDGFVGFCMERSIEMIVAMLGILKAGAAYVPLDPTYPPERLAFMADDAGFEILLSQARLSERLPPRHGRLVLIDSQWPEIAEQSAENLDIPMLPANLAYVIYTSGSTGRPKGSNVPHQAIMRLVFDMDYVNVGAADIVAHVSNSSFDAATFEIWTCLLHGARLQIVAQDTMLSPADFAAHIREHHINVMCLTPAFFNQMIRAMPDAFAQVRHLLIGGESLDPGAVRQLLLHAPEDVTNGYGPTESTTFACTYRIKALDPLAVSIPIGRPITNTRLYILDDYLRPSAIGVPGELYIAGDGLARGYLNQPALTAEKFIPNPFEDGGSRMYRTGDRARYLPTGDIECLGRLDHQVKLRGFRIELGEIEARLSEADGVKEAVVLVREDAPGDRRLVAYIAGLSDEGHVEKVNHLREQLAGSLPEYMVPATYVFLDQLPLTPNGKVDRRALPAPESNVVEDEYVAPRNVVEEKLALVWAKALRVERVGIHDNFYALGGDSLLSMQLIAYAKSKGIGFTPRQIMQHQTIAELAEVASVVEADYGTESATAGSVPLSPRQQWFFELDVENPGYHNTWVATEVEPDFDPSLMQSALRHLCTVHDALQLRFRKTGDGWTQFIVEPDGAQEVERVDLSAMTRVEQLRAMQEKGTSLHASFDLTHGPLLKLVHFRLGDGLPGRLLFIAHHLILDGIALNIITQDISKLYAQAAKGKPFQLPAKTTSFKEWVERISAQAQSKEVLEEAPYWQSIAPTMASLPVDHVDGDDVESSARVFESRLSAADTHALQTALHRWGASVPDAITAALLEAFTRWTGRGELLLELTHHGRDVFAEDMDLTRTVGWLTANYPVALRHEGADDAKTVFSSVRRQLSIIPHMGVGYGLLRYSSGNASLKQRLEVLPQPQVFFNYLGQIPATRKDKHVDGMETFGPHRCPTHTRTWSIYCKAMTAGDELVVQWEYSRNRYRLETIEALAQGCLATLRALSVEARDADKLAETR